MKSTRSFGASIRRRRGSCSRSASLRSYETMLRNQAMNLPTGMEIDGASLAEIWF